MQFPGVLTSSSLHIDLRSMFNSGWGYDSGSSLGRAGKAHFTKASYFSKQADCWWQARSCDLQWVQLFCLVLGFIVVVRSLSLFSLFVTSWTETYQAPLSSTVLPELAQIHVHWVGDASHLFFCCLIVILPSIYPSIRIFSVSLLFTSGAQRNGASATVLPKNIQDCFTLGLASLMEICSSRDSQESSLAPQFKSINSLFSAFFMVQFSHPYMTTGKNIALIVQTLLAKWCLFFLICCLDLL